MLPATLTAEELAQRFGSFEPVSSRNTFERAMSLQRLASGQGYMAKSPHQQPRLWLGAMPEDAVFSKPGVGHVNITEARAYIKRSKVLKAERLNLSETVIQSVLEGKHDPSIVAEMTIQEANVPLIFLNTAGGLHLIDGHNRLRKRVDQKLTFAKYYAFKNEAIEHLRVENYRLEEGVWVKIETMANPDAVAA